MSGLIVVVTSIWVLFASSVSGDVVIIDGFVGVGVVGEIVGHFIVTKVAFQGDGEFVVGKGSDRSFAVTIFESIGSEQITTNGSDQNSAFNKIGPVGVVEVVNDGGVDNNSLFFGFASSWEGNSASVFDFIQVNSDDGVSDEGVLWIQRRKHFEDASKATSHFGVEIVEFGFAFVRTWADVFAWIGGVGGWFLWQFGDAVFSFFVFGAQKLEGSEESVGIERLLWVEQNPEGNDFAHATGSASNFVGEVLVSSFGGDVHSHEFQSAEFASGFEAKKFDGSSCLDKVSIFGDVSQGQKEFSEAWVAEVGNCGFSLGRIWVGNVWSVSQFLESWQAEFSSDFEAWQSQKCEVSEDVSDFGWVVEETSSSALSNGSENVEFELWNASVGTSSLNIILSDGVGVVKDVVILNSQSSAFSSVEGVNQIGQSIRASLRNLSFFRGSDSVFDLNGGSLSNFIVWNFFNFNLFEGFMVIMVIRVELVESLTKE